MHRAFRRRRFVGGGVPSQAGRLRRLCHVHAKLARRRRHPPRGLRVGGRPLCGRNGGPENWHSLLFCGPVQTVPPARGGLHVRRIRQGPDPQPGRAVQPRNQVRRLLGSGPQIRGRLCGHRPLLPGGCLSFRPSGARGGISAHLPDFGGSGPQQGPDLLPVPALAGAAEPNALPYRPSDQAGSTADCQGGGPAFCGEERLPGNLLRGQGGPSHFPEAKTGFRGGRCRRGF